jgi:hypothetical protein
MASERWQAAICTEISAVDALWQDFAIIRHEPNAAPLRIACDRMTYSRDPRGPVQPAWGISTACRPGEIQFGHINLHKMVFDLDGLPLSKTSANNKKHKG